MAAVGPDLGRERRRTDADQRVPVERRAYRPREIAQLHGLAPATVYAAIYGGRLRHHRVGKAIVVPTEAIDEWLAASAA